jgi:hypothetical protein
MMAIFLVDAGGLDRFYEAEHGRTIDDDISGSSVYDAANVAKQLFLWDCLGTYKLSDDEEEWRVKAFLCLGVILEGVLRDDDKRRSFAAVYDNANAVNIGSRYATSYHEAVYVEARGRLLHLECESDFWRAGVKDISQFGQLAPDFAFLRTVKFQSFGGFHASGHDDQTLRRIPAELIREADLAADWLERRTATRQPDNNDTIPAEFRSKPLSKKKAAQLLGKPNEDSGVKWLNACIKDGTIRCEDHTRQSFVFDLRQFPESVHDQMRPDKSRSTPAKSR